MNKAFFLDRDGVINVDHGYIYEPEKFEFLPGVFDACKLIAAAGYKIVIITNQSGIGRGLYTEDQFIDLTEWMLDRFIYKDIDIDGVYFCPHHPSAGIGEYKQACNCRKPQPGMLIEAAEDLGLELSQCFMIGDKSSDIEVGNNAGVKQSVLVSTGKPIDSNTNTPVFDNLIDAVKSLLRA